MRGQCVTDEVTVSPPYNGAPSALAAWNVRLIFGSIMLAFCMVIIVLVLWKGDGNNSLHKDALSWSYALIGCILLGFGVGAVLEPLVTAFNKR
jgi:hypothetical protein